MLNNILYYIQGWFRYHIYYSKNFGFLLRKHIREQIDYRVAVMNRECYTSGSCVKCGCKTIALQMANKPCDGDCYISMQSKRMWNKIKTGKFDGK